MEDLPHQKIVVNLEKSIPNLINVWKNPTNIKVVNTNINIEMSEDGVAIKLDSKNEKANIFRHQNSFVIKVFGNFYSFSFD